MAAKPTPRPPLDSTTDAAIPSAMSGFRGNAIHPLRAFSRFAFDFFEVDTVFRFAR